MIRPESVLAFLNFQDLGLLLMPADNSRESGLYNVHQRLAARALWDALEARPDADADEVYHSSPKLPTPVPFDNLINLSTQEVLSTLVELRRLLIQ